MKQLIILFFLFLNSFVSIAQSETPIIMNLENAKLVSYDKEKKFSTYEMSKKNLINEGIKMTFSNGSSENFLYTATLFCKKIKGDPFLYTFGYFKNKDSNIYEYQGTKKLKFEIGDVIYIEEIKLFNKENTFQTPGNSFKILVVK